MTRCSHNEHTEYMIIYDYETDSVSDFLYNGRVNSFETYKMLWNRPHVCSIRFVSLSRRLSNVIYDRTVSIDGVYKILNRVSVDYHWRYLVIWDSWQFPLPKINSVEEDCDVTFHYLVSSSYGHKFFADPWRQLLYLLHHVHNRN